MPPCAYFGHTDTGSAHGLGPPQQGQAKKPVHARSEPSEMHGVRLDGKDPNSGLGGRGEEAAPVGKA